MQIKGYRIHNWDGYMQWDEFDILEPGEGEALIEVEACGIGLTVLHCIEGKVVSDPALLPLVPGHELVGRVVTLNTSLSGLEIGQRVMAYFYLSCGTCSACLAGNDSLCKNLGGWVGVQRDGGYASHAVLPVHNLLPVPNNISAIDATAVIDAIATPFHICKRRAKVQPGDRVAVIGAGGGVGIHLVQMARLFGAQVAGLEISEEKFDVIREFGGQPILSRNFHDVSLGELWDGYGPSVVIDLICTPESMSWGIDALEAGGRMVVLTGFLGVKFPVNPRDLVFRELNLMGSRYASKAEVYDSALLVRSGDIQPVVTRVVTPQDAPEVHNELHEGTLIGRGALVWE